MKFLFDTDHLSILQARSGTEYSILAARMAGHPTADFAVSVISLHEQTLGAQTFLGRARTSADLVRGYLLLRQIFDSFVSIQMVPFDTQAATALDGLVAQWIRISAMDLRIAAVALAQRLVLLTRNARDFNRVPGLVIQDWTV